MFAAWFIGLMFSIEILSLYGQRDIFTLPEHERIIAVCISGQPGRMLPELILSGLIHANINIQFHIYFNLQHSSPIFTNKHAVNEASLSKYHNMSTGDISASLHALFRTINSRVVEVQFHAPHAAEYWKQALGLNGSQALDRISQFKGQYSHVILNMYQLQSHCASQIVRQERELNVSYVHVVNTREDVFFFRPLDLTALFKKYLSTNSSSSGSGSGSGSGGYGSAGHSGSSSAAYPNTPAPALPYCDLLTKGCLGWGGLNMRVQVLRREHLPGYLDRIAGMRRLYSRGNESYFNPEIFEAAQAQALGMRVCEVPVEEYPVTAARLSYLDGLPCFVHPELKRYEKESPPCVPEAVMQTAITRLCPRLKTRYQFIPWQTTPFIHNSAFPAPRNAITGQHGRMSGHE